MTTQFQKSGAKLCATILLGAGASSAAPTFADGSSNGAEPHAATPECISVRAEARRGATGYDHWVFIDSDCDLPAACDVSTDVSPESMTVTLQPRGTGRVLTATATSVKRFTPYVTCQLGPPD